MNTLCIVVIATVVIYMAYNFASSKGGFGFERTSSTAVVPSQRTVVRSRRR